MSDKGHTPKPQKKKNQSVPTTLIAFKLLTRIDQGKEVPEEASVASLEPGERSDVLLNE